MKHAPSWNKLVEHFHGDDDVVFWDRERRPDAASVVLAAGTAQAREEQEALSETGSTRHADWSISQCMSVSRSAH